MNTKTGISTTAVGLVLVLSLYFIQITDIQIFNDLRQQLFPGSRLDHFHRVPTISFSDLINDDQTIDPKILSSMQEFGFFYVTNVPDYNAIQELTLLKHFFSLPDATKMALAVKKHEPKNSNIYRGYGPLVDSGTQHKEMFNIGRHEAPTPTYEQTDSPLDKLRAISREQSVWPKSGDGEFDGEFRKVFSEGLKIRMNIARGVIRSIGRSLEADHLISRFTESEFSTLGLRRYPTRTRRTENMNSVYDGVALSELEHEDSTVTVLSTFNYTGLQALYGEDYLDVPPSDDGFIVNIGTLVEDITDKKIKAVRHRVKQVDFERHSIPCFFNPSFDADISKSISGRTTAAGEETQLFGEWMRDYLPSVEPGLLDADMTKEAVDDVDDGGH